MTAKQRLQGISARVFLLPLGLQLSRAEWELLFFALPFEEQIRIAKYKHWQDRQRALLGNVLVRWMIYQFSNLHHILFTRDKMGRPYLTNKNWHGDFNLSHSGEWIVSAVTNQGRIGVDVEKIKQINDEVLNYVLSEAEKVRFHQSPQKERTKIFYEIWTMKEAIYKTGLFPNTTAASLDTVEIRKRQNDILHTELFYVDEKHPVSICLNCKQLAIKRTNVRRDELISFIELISLQK